VCLEHKNVLAILPCLVRHFLVKTYRLRLMNAAMSGEESLLAEGQTDPNDGEMYELGGDDDDGEQPTWSTLTVAALKAALVERGLQTTGRKAELVARLEASQSRRLSVIFA